MRHFKQLFVLLFASLLSIGAWAGTGSITFDFEDDGAHRSSGSNSYAAGGNSYTENSVNISCTYMDVVTSGTPLSGSANAMGRVAKNTTNSPVLLIGPIDMTDKTITEISYTTKGVAAMSQVCEYSTNGTSWTSAVSTESMPTSATPKTSGTINVTGTNNFYVRITTSVASSTGSNRDLQIDDVVISYSYEDGGTPTCVAPTFSPAAGTVLSGTTVALSTTTDGADIYYTMGADPADPTTGSTKYTTPIEITSATTIKAIAAKESYNNSTVATASYTIATPLTTMDAIFARATEVGNTATDVVVTFNNWVVTGVKNSNAYVTDGTKGFIIYTSGHGFAVGNVLSGTAACKVQLYNGSAELTNLTSSTTGLTVTTGGTPSLNVLDAEGIAALTGANTGSLIKISGACTQESSKYYIGGVQLYNSLYAFSVSAGTSYECSGIYVQYNSTKEILPRSAADIVVSSSVAVTGIDLTESTASVEAGETVTLHASVEPGTATNKTIVWTVESGSDKASVADGVVTGIAAGTAVIRAASDEDASIYEECTVTVTAADPTKHVVTFDATVDAGESPLSKSNITFTCSNGVLNNGTEYRLYKNSTNTFACSVGNIIKIEFIGTSSNPASGFEDPAEGSFVTDGYNGVWTGNAASVTFTASNAQVRATEINVTYKEDSRAEAGLAWDPATDIEITVGDALPGRTLLNPNSIDAAEITITSDNTDLATVTAGVVGLVADATGTANITATFDGNATYKPATVSYTITVNAAAIVLTDYYQKVASTADIVEGTYLIVYEEGSVAFDGGLATLDAASNTIPVTIVGDKIGVTSATEAATVYIDPAAGTIKSASDHYIGVSSWNNGLQQTATYVHNVLEIDGDGNAQVGIYNAEWNTTGGTMRLQYNKSEGQTRFRYYKNGGQQSIALYKLYGEVVKADPGISWDSESAELTLNDYITPADYPEPGLIILADLGENPLDFITLSSDNESLATINKTTDGQIKISWVPDVTGIVHFTASYPGDATYKAVTAVCTIKINPAHSIYVSPSLNVNFGSVLKDATVDDKTITVTLTGVDNATATLGGDHPEVFSISPAALTASGDITISASSATAGTFAATLTISDDASAADPKVVNLSLTVNEPETPDDVSGTWTLVTDAATLAAGKKVIIAQYVDADGAINTMAAQKSNNRGVVESAVAGATLTPATGTKVMTLVDAGTGKFYLQTSDGKYLYNASTSGNSYLRTKDEETDASWTISVTAEGVATITSVENTNRTIMRYNENGTNPALFNCYASGQSDIALYMLEVVAPAADYTRDELTSGKIGTLYVGKATTSYTGATFYEIAYKSADGKEITFEEVTGQLAANTPYIFEATAAEINLVYENPSFVAENESEVNGLVGTLSEKHVGPSADIYYISNNTLYNASSFSGTATDLTVGANRCYIDITKVPLPSASPAPGKRYITLKVDGENAATGIDELNASETPMKMIIDGKLYILRGEKMYNANGQLVK